jgi:hypothetical protein
VLPAETEFLGRTSILKSSVPKFVCRIAKCFYHLNFTIFI